MRRRFVSVPRAPRIRANERIRVPEVRVIKEDGEQAGVMPTREALAYARERGLDLVEISPNARPPVCKVMDFGKFKYEEAKKTRAAKKKQHSAQIKEVKLRPKIDEHDYQFKVSNARRFLGQHHKVKLTIMFRGREMAHKERGMDLLKRVIEDLTDLGQAEHIPKLEGRNLSTIMSPHSTKGRAKPRPGDAEQALQEPAGAAGEKGVPAEVGGTAAAPAGAAAAGAGDEQPSEAPGTPAGAGALATAAADPGEASSSERPDTSRQDA